MDVFSCWADLGAFLGGGGAAKNAETTGNLEKPPLRQRLTVLKTSKYVMHGHQNCTMSSRPPHAPFCHLRMRDQYDIVHTVAVLAKIIEKTFKKTLFFDFDRVVLHQYCMTGFRDRKSRLKKGRSQLCQIDGG